MKKVIQKIFLLFLVVFIIDYLSGIILISILEHSPDGRYFKANYSLNTSTEDIIIFGSSRAETNYVPFVFEDSLELTCWNAGRGGQGLPFWYAMGEGILKRYSPKIAIINVEIDFLTMNLKNYEYEHAGFLRPFYYNNPEIRPIINEISKFEKYFLFSKLYAFNSSFYYLFRPYFLKNIDGKLEDKGWKTRYGVLDKSNVDIQIIRTKRRLNNQTLKLFRDFVSNLTSMGCEVYVAISPDFGLFVEQTSTIEYLKGMDKIKLIDLSKNVSFYQNRNFYKDPEHLNIIGAIEYSKILSREILKYKLTNSL